MSDVINLLPEDLQPKGYIPKPKVNVASEQPTEMKRPVNEVNKIREVVIDSASIKKDNNFSINSVSVTQNKTAPVVEKKPKSSFWDNVFAKKTEEKKVNSIPQSAPLMTEAVTRIDQNSSAPTSQKPERLAVNNVPSASQTKPSFDFKKILKWLTAGKKSDNQDEFGINLVPKEAEVLPMLTIGKRVLIRIVPALIIIVGAYLLAQTYSVFVKQKTQNLVDQLTTSVKISDADIQKLEKNASGLDKKVTIMRNILQRHIYWTKLLDYLEQVFIAEVYIKSLTAESEGSVIIEAETDSFTSVAKQYLVLQADSNIKEVSITGADRPSEEEPIKFSIKLTIWPGLMYPNAFVNEK